MQNVSDSPPLCLQKLPNFSQAVFPALTEQGPGWVYFWMVVVVLVVVVVVVEHRLGFLLSPQRTLYPQSDDTLDPVSLIPLSTRSLPPTALSYLHEFLRSGGGMPVLFPTALP